MELHTQSSGKGRKNEDILPYNRLLEIASRALQDMVDAESMQADIYFQRTLELTEEERIILGVDDLRLFK